MLFNQIKDSILDQTISISDILRKTLVLSYGLKNEQLKEWVNLELDGYNDEVETPNYRIFRGLSFGTFQNGYQLAKNAPIHLMHMPKELQPRLNQLIVHNGVRELEALSKGKNDDLHMPWPAEIIAIYNSMGNQTGFQCMAAWRVVTKTQLIGILDSIRNRLLKFLLELEVEYPELSQREVTQVPITQGTVIKIFQHCVFDSSIKMGSDNKFTGETKIINTGEPDEH